jgi:hypothetical protein
MKPVSPARLLMLCLVPAALLALSVRAEDGGVLEQVPDASVGEGGADRDNPEGEDGVGPGGTCRSSRDCAARFGCVEGRCRYVGVRQAERAGCLLGPEDGLAVAGLALGVAALGRRRR